MGLSFGPRITVEDRADFGTHGIKFFTDQGRDNLIRDELTALHHRLGLKANWRSRFYGSAEHVTSRQLAHAMPLYQSLSLGTLARTGGAQKDDVHVHVPQVSISECDPSASPS
jgi:hypothetical protein